MLFIRHRVNSVKDLETIPPRLGIELDLRSAGSRLILQHDPFQGGDRFEDLLKHYRHAFMIVNVKTEGVEEEARQLLRKYGIKEYFFLDLSFPALIKLTRKGEKNIAIRFSEYEPLEQCLALKGKVRWVWIDCFTRLPLNDKNYSILRECFKLCIVSPELQNHPKEKIASFKKALSDYKIDAVCTKHPELWER